MYEQYRLDLVGYVKRKKQNKKSINKAGMGRVGVDLEEPEEE